MSTRIINPDGSVREIPDGLTVGHIWMNKTTVPHSVMASQINAAVLAERQRIVKRIESLADEIGGPHGVMIEKLACRILEGK